jgi:hypothetical protein
MSIKDDWSEDILPLMLKPWNLGNM